MKIEINRFWMPDDFVRVHAKNLSSSAHSVYMSLSSHANKNGEAFISYEKMGNELKFSKNTVKRAVDELIAYQILVRLDKKTGRASHLQVLSVPNGSTKPYQNLSTKELNKEYFKENDLNKFKNDRDGAKDGIDWEKRKQVLAHMRENLNNILGKKRDDDNK